MSLTLRKLHPLFVAEAGGVDLRRVEDEETLSAIRAALDEYAVLVFHHQPLTDEEHLAFSQRLDGALHMKTTTSVFQARKFISDALSDISNLDENGEIMTTDHRRRMYNLGNRLWHTDASFQDPPGRYSLLAAKVVPDVPADTEFADMRAAYDALSPDMKQRIEGLHAHHSVLYSRQAIGFEFSAEEAARNPGAVQPLVRTLPETGRRSLYLASHAARILEMPVPDGRLLLRELTEHATRSDFRYVHRWRVDDLVIWDNRATMHRGLPYDDTKHRRELRRVTTLDLPRPLMARPPVAAWTATA